MASASWLAPALIFAACASAAAPVVTTETSASVVLNNQGGALEGHTPRGFAGMGTGLFVGDNLNPGFPDGDGVQIYLTFEASNPMSSVSSATLSSRFLNVRGTPFDDLGTLWAEAVTYDTFGPGLFDLSPVGAPVACVRTDAGIDCDVTDVVRGAADFDEARIQFRLRFDLAGDDDGSQDLAMFFRSDSNTNEPGLFTLTITR